MAVTMAGLAARGETIVENISVIERGYEDAIDKISSLGGVISRYEVETGSYR
jgi:UDP-N-acetylglucosamine enolpyruvyl transferase